MARSVFRGTKNRFTGNNPAGAMPDLGSGLERLKHEVSVEQLLGDP